MILSARGSSNLEQRACLMRRTGAQKKEVSSHISVTGKERDSHSLGDLDRPPFSSNLHPSPQLLGSSAHRSQIPPFEFVL